MDGARCNRKALQFLNESEGAKYFVQVCSAHGFSRLSAVLAKIEPFKNIVLQAHEMIKLIKNRDAFRSELERIQKLAVDTTALVLLGFCETRFAYVIIALHRLWNLKRHILLMLPFFYAQIEKAITPKEKALLISVRASISSENFWRSLLDFVYVFEPLLVRVRFFDAARPGSVCWVLEAWEGLRAEFTVRMEKCSFNNVPIQPLLDVIAKYRKSYTYPVHGYADLLEPSHWPLNNERMTRYSDLMSFVMKEYGVPSNEIVDALALVSRPGFLVLPAFAFWHAQSGKLPSFGRVAARICAGVASSSDCERDFSSMKYVWSSLRNRLKPEMANVLTTLYADRVKSNSGQKFPTPSLTADLAHKLLACTQLGRYEEVAACSSAVLQDASDSVMVSTLNEETDALRKEVFSSDDQQPTPDASVDLSNPAAEHPEVVAEDDYLSDVDEAIE